MKFAKKFGLKELTGDHLSGWQSDYIEQSTGKFIQIDADFSIPYCYEPMYEEFEKAAYSQAGIADIVKFVKINRKEDDCQYFQPSVMTCIYDSNGKLHSPSKKVPAVVFEANDLKHVVWYKNGVPHREGGLPNYIIDYEYFEHTTLMLHFNEDYKLDDVINESDPSLTMPAKISYCRVPRHGLCFTTYYYKNGVGDGVEDGVEHIA